MKHQHPLLLFILLLTGMVWLSCSSVKVATRFDPAADFSHYRTYKWLPRKPMGPSARMRKLTPVEQQIIADVERELAAKGMQKLVKGEPDLWVTYHIRVKDKIDVNHYGYRYWRHGPRGRVVEVHRYKKGTIVIDLIDRQAKQLVWRGWASSVLNHPGEVTEKIDRALHKLFREFPPH